MITGGSGSTASATPSAIHVLPVPTGSASIAPPCCRTAAVARRKASAWPGLSQGGGVSGAVAGSSAEAIARSTGPGSDWMGGERTASTGSGSRRSDSATSTGSLAQVASQRSAVGRPQREVPRNKVIEILLPRVG